MAKFKDLTGEQFGKLTVKSRYGYDKYNKITWKCSCECGSEDVVVLGHELRSGSTKSCGCIKRNNMIQMNTTHGMADTRFIECGEEYRRDVMIIEQKDIKIMVVEGLRCAINGEVIS